MDKDEEESSQLRLSYLETSAISGFVCSVPKPPKKIKVMSTNGKENALIITNEEVKCGVYCSINKIFYFMDG